MSLTPPVGLLVTDRCQQPPVDAVQIARLLEPGTIPREAAVEMPDEGSRADVIEFPGVAVIAVAYLSKQARTLRLDQVVIGLRK